MARKLTPREAAALAEAGKFFGDPKLGKTRIAKFHQDMANRSQRKGTSASRPSNSNAVRPGTMKSTPVRPSSTPVRPSSTTAVRPTRDSGVRTPYKPGSSMVRPGTKATSTTKTTKRDNPIGAAVPAAVAVGVAAAMHVYKNRATQPSFRTQNALNAGPKGLNAGPKGLPSGPKGLPSGPKGIGTGPKALNAAPIAPSPKQAPRGTSSGSRTSTRTTLKATPSTSVKVKTTSTPGRTAARTAPKPNIKIAAAPKARGGNSSGTTGSGRVPGKVKADRMPSGINAGRSGGAIGSGGGKLRSPFRPQGA